MIITVAGFKGGIGKTTSAIAFAYWLSQNRGKTLLIDGDPNRSAIGWVNRGPGMPFGICDQLSAPRESRNYDHLVIDTPARPNREDLESLSKGADLLVLPSAPSALALDALKQSIDALDSLGANYLCYLSIVPSAPQKTGAAARAALSRLNAPLATSEIRKFAAWEKASAKGLIAGAVKGDSNAKNAQADGDALAAEVVALTEALLKDNTGG